jgi:tRNA-2-methylthio-N6-dimethylallyladenosine synthase
VAVVAGFSRRLDPRRSMKLFLTGEPRAPTFLPDRESRPDAEGGWLPAGHGARRTAKGLSRPATGTERSTSMDSAISRLKTYFLQTYGCQMNVYDSEILASLLEAQNYQPATAPEQADVLVFNTCCVRDNADQKVYGRLGDFKFIKAERPGQILVVAGCLAQKDGEAFLERFPQVDIVLGTHDVQALPELVQRVQAGEGRIVQVGRQGHHLDLPASPRGASSAMVPISMGCDQWCTYCIVPYVRGQLHSRPVVQVLAEVRRLVGLGYREIMLLGQNVNDYGRDLQPQVEFADLLEALGGLDAPDRLRFTSPHPAGFTPRVIQVMAANPSVCEHIHLPLQAGDDQVLARMKRGYTGQQFLDLVARLRQAIPDLGITTDIIVGFPGETEAQFQRTLEVVQQARFDSAFMFAYSPRPGTPGSLFTDQVPESERMERLYRLIHLQNGISEEKHRQRMGREVEVLVEGRSKKTSSRLTGRTRQNWLVHFDSEEDFSGRLARVRLDQAFMWGFVGTLLEVEPSAGS